MIGTDPRRAEACPGAGAKAKQFGVAGTEQEARGVYSEAQ